jgi:hypothetical protein
VEYVENFPENRRPGGKNEKKLWIKSMFLKKKDLTNRQIQGRLMYGCQSEDLTEEKWSLIQSGGGTKDL